MAKHDQRRSARWARTGLSALTFVVGLGTATSFAAATIDLDGQWLFRTDPGGTGASRHWGREAPDDAEPVDVPSSWNSGRNGAYDGEAWYFRDIVLPATVARSHLELRFGATFYRSVIWVNGVRAGGHEGGYTEYSVDVSRLLHAGINRLAVEIDNRPGFATIPGFAMRQAPTGTVWYDWWRNGGIVRPVSLDISDGGMIRSRRISTVIAGGHADVSANVTVWNVSSATMSYGLAGRLYAPDGRLVATSDAAVTLPAGGAGPGMLAFHVERPELWNVGAAKLYRVVTTLQDSRHDVLDEKTDETGLRRIEIRDRRLYVNGRQVRLTGISRHEDSPWEGLAETAGTIRHDWDELAGLHVTLTRPVHYPQPPEVLEQADRDGILLVPEIPVWQMSEAQLADPRLRKLAARMMTEVIEQDANHPSIFAWSVCNESDARLPGGTAYVRRMKALVRQLDPGRFVTFADADVAIAPWHDVPVLHDVDFIMANAYFGNWDGPLDRLDPWLDFMDRTYRDKMVVISEFGWPGIFSDGRAAADRDRIANFTASLDVLSRRDFIGGAILWSYQDYRSPRNLSPGLVDGYVDHGLVDENRQRKPSFDAWERLNRPLGIVLDWKQADGGPVGFQARLMPNGPDRLPSYPLPGYRLRWRMAAADGTTLGQGGNALPNVDTATVVNGTWPHPPPTSGGTLTVTVEDAAGFTASEATLADHRLVIGAAPYRPDLAAGKP